MLGYGICKNSQVWSGLCTGWETPQSCKWRKGCWWRCLFSQLCILQPLFIFLQHAAALRHCPTGKMTTSSVHMTQFFNTFFLHAVRNAFWKWGEDDERKRVLTALLCGSGSVSLTKSYGWEPHPELTAEVIEPICSTLSHLFTKA